MSEEYEYETYDVAWVHLEEGDYTRDELLRIIEGLEEMNRMVSRTMKELQ